MTDSRLETFRGMVTRSPGNALARFGLANEAMKEGLWEEAVEHLGVYLGMYDDEGNGYGRLAEGLFALGRPAEARAALARGIEAANRFGHPGMASELEARLHDGEDDS
jgi:predicted Zn-dependent protease